MYDSAVIVLAVHNRLQAPPDAATNNNLLYYTANIIVMQRTAFLSIF